MALEQKQARKQREKKRASWWESNQITCIIRSSSVFLQFRTKEDLRIIMKTVHNSSFNFKSSESTNIHLLSPQPCSNIKFVKHNEIQARTLPPAFYTEI